MTLSNPMPVHLKRLTLIVAATSTNGIGLNGTLPWPMLKQEMGYFARVTKRLPPPSTSPSDVNVSRQNVVIMGSATYFSIPAHLRPLKGRTNVVLSSKAPETFRQETRDAGKQTLFVADSIASGISKVRDAAEKDEAFEMARVFVIGGQKVYGDAVKLVSEKDERDGRDGAWKVDVLLTRIERDYHCDTFFPLKLGQNGSEDERWRKRSNRELSDYVGEDVQDVIQQEEVEIDGKKEMIGFKFMLYTQT